MDESKADMVASGRIRLRRTQSGLEHNEKRGGGFFPRTTAVVELTDTTPYLESQLAGF